MKRFLNLRRAVLGVCVAVACVASVGFSNNTATAGDCSPHYAYKTVTVYEVRSVAYTKYVTYYDHCGHPYQVAKTFYRQVQVPVQKLVAVNY